MSNTSKSGEFVFPPVIEADRNGLLCFGPELCVETLTSAYRQGIFPWPLFSSGPVPWFSPPQRALLFLDKVHISRSLVRRRRKSSFTFSINSQFSSVVKHCSTVGDRAEEEGTWITQDMIEAYVMLHKQGYAHSVECFDGSELVGGMYGVSIGGMFAGESMFSLRSDASKLCLWYLIEYLQERGAPWLDCQQLTPLLESFGAVEVSRKTFLKLLKAQRDRNIRLFPKEPSGQKGDF